VWCFLSGTDWIHEYRLDELRFQRVDKNCAFILYTQETQQIEQCVTFGWYQPSPRPNVLMNVSSFTFSPPSYRTLFVNNSYRINSASIRAPPLPPPLIHEWGGTCQGYCDGSMSIESCATRPDRQRTGCSEWKDTLTAGSAVLFRYTPRKHPTKSKTVN
jgi:hypothetical protein